MISQDKARQKAAEGLRFEFGGNIPHLGRVRYSEEDKKYVFSIIVSYPRVPEDTDEDMTFDDTTMVGEIIVDEETGKMTHTPESVLQNRVGEIADNGEITYSDS